MADPIPGAQQIESEELICVYGQEDKPYVYVLMICVIYMRCRGTRGSLSNESTLTLPQQRRT